MLSLTWNTLQAFTQRSTDTPGLINYFSKTKCEREVAVKEASAIIVHETLNEYQTRTHTSIHSTHRYTHPSLYTPLNTHTHTSTLFERKAKTTNHPKNPGN